MKNYLFLYPIKEYFDYLIKNWYNDELSKSVKKPEYLNDIIDARYRNEGYLINWLLFSSVENPLKPDLSIISPIIKIHRKDEILVAGISFEEHIKNKKYPDPNYILNQINDVTRLVLGGFHQNDCVDKLAEATYQKGIDTFVDEDTTELFFPRISLNEIPLKRKKWTLKDLGIIPSLIEITQESRKDRPWLVQT